MSLKTAPSTDAAALEREVSELRERVADLQSDKVLIEEELREAITGRDQVEAKSAKVLSLSVYRVHQLGQRGDNFSPLPGHHVGIETGRGRTAGVVGSFIPNLSYSAAALKMKLYRVHVIDQSLTLMWKKCCYI